MRRSRSSAGAVFTVFVCAFACGCSVPIVAGLEDGDASRVVVALEQSGVASEKDRDPDKEGTYRVLVARDDASTALSVLADDGLPPRAAPGVLDALGKGSLVPSRTAEQARFVTGTGDELERSLLSLDGVVSARVHLGVPAHDPLAFDDKPPTATASVLIRHRGPTPPIAPGEVQRLVAGAIPGLAPDQVSVVMVPAPPRGRPPERELARLGPLTVTHASLFALRSMIGVAVLLNAALLACVVGLWSRLRRLQQAQPGPEAAEAPARRRA